MTPAGLPDDHTKASTGFSKYKGACTSTLCSPMVLVQHLFKHYILDAQANGPQDIMGFYFDEVDEAKPDSTGNQKGE